WCGPCRMQTPILEQLSQEIDEDELKILKMDVDENPETARQFGIMSIPTLMFKKDGEVVKQVAGVHTKDQLKAIIAELS
ncbi:TPA: thioredoxin family protein, partial [Streptococcus pyogenes]